MNKQELQIAAKEFCDAKNYNTFLVGFLKQFAQHLLDTGNMVENSKKCSGCQCYTALSNFETEDKCILCDVHRDENERLLRIYPHRIKELEKEVQHLRDNAFQPSNTPQSGEVKSAEEILSALDVTEDPYGEDCYHKEEVMCAMKRFSDQFKHPAYDLLLASYNDLKAEDNKKALEINRLMSSQNAISDEEIEVKAEYYATKYSPIQAAVLVGKLVRDQFKKQ